MVGETGGKDFVAHPSAIPSQVATALSRGSFEFQGQNARLLRPIYQKTYGQVKKY